jgi:hypothetical protein
MAESRQKGIVCSSGDVIYSRLAKRAILAMLVSVVFEGILLLMLYVLMRTVCSVHRVACITAVAQRRSCSIAMLCARPCVS